MTNSSDARGGPGGAGAAGGGALAPATDQSPGSGSQPSALANPILHLESAPIRILSSMATRGLLAALSELYAAQNPAAAVVVVESVGGVDAARRIQAGEAFDAVVLASDAIERLIDGGSAVAGSRVDLVSSGVAVAVKAGARPVDIGSESAVRQAVLGAGRVGYSTGPSGVQLQQLFARWGIADEIRDRTVQAPPGVPVGSLVARGEVDLGFQQLSELLGVTGIDVLGPLPDAIQITTVFSGAVVAVSERADEAGEVLAWMAGPAAVAVKRRQGMEPV